MFSLATWVVIGFILVIVAGLVGLLIFVISGVVGVDALFELNKAKADLTCWHCGTATRAGRRQCQHCGHDLR